MRKEWKIISANQKVKIIVTGTHYERRKLSATATHYSRKDIAKKLNSKEETLLEKQSPGIV